jgi:hypothetical protein
MKITKRQLRRIIKEEKARLQSESMAVAGDDYWKLHDGTKKLLSAMFDFVEELRDSDDAWESAEQLEIILSSFESQLGIRL